MERIERTVLSNLIHNEDYTRRVLPFIKEEYFSDRLEKILFTEISKFVNKYNALPSKESLSIEMNGSKNINEDEYKEMQLLNLFKITSEGIQEGIISIS